MVLDLTHRLGFLGQKSISKYSWVAVLCPGSAGLGVLSQGAVLTVVEVGEQRSCVGQGGKVWAAGASVDTVTPQLALIGIPGGSSGLEEALGTSVLWRVEEAPHCYSGIFPGKGS